VPRTTREKGPTADGKDYRTVSPLANAGSRRLRGARSDGGAKGARSERKVRLPNWSNKLD